MKTEFLPGRGGYDIPCRSYLHGEPGALIVCHGFGSSKESPMVLALNEEMPKHGMGVFSFDFPAHGESPAGQEGLRVPNCLEDLAAVEAEVQRRAPGAEIAYFGSSFGAYLTLLYLASYPHKGRRAFLRSSAVTMPRLVNRWVDHRARADLARQGYFVPDHDYVREMRITPAFLADLERYDVFQRYRRGMAQLFMIHGGRDSVAPPEDARRFAECSGAAFYLVPDGEHNLMGEGELETVLRCAEGFLLGRKAD